MGHIEAVCVVHEVRPDAGKVGRTAIDKRAVTGTVQVQALGLDGDTQCDRAFHGGHDRAVYAYAAEDSAWWSTELGRDLAPGQFGENLRTSGIDVSGAVIGERWQVGAGGLQLEVRCPRMPCQTFQRFLDEPHWVKRFTDHGAPGAYLRVITPGPVTVGDPIEVINRPAHGVRIHDTFHRLTLAHAEALLAVTDLEPDLRKAAEAVRTRTQPTA